MSELVISSIFFGCIFAAALLGQLLRKLMPEEHLTGDTKDLVKVSMGLVGTMTALVLGLLVASAKEAYDTKRHETTQMAAQIAFLDRALANYGPETAEARALLRQIVERMIGKLWIQSSAATSLRDEPTGFRSAQLYNSIQNLTARDDLHQALKTHALTTANDLAQARWLLYEQSSSSISIAMLVILDCWLMILFFSFALFAPRNLTVIIALLVAALSVSGGILLILELDQPFVGFIQIPQAPMQRLLGELGH